MHATLVCIVVGRKENVEKLLAHHANPATQDDQANGLLHWAGTRVSPEIIKMPVQKCPALDINAPNSQGQTPLLRAAANGHHSSVAMLLDCGANPHTKDLEDQTVLHWLASNGSFGILSVFRSKDIAFDLEAKSKLGKTPLLRAAEKGHALMVEESLSQGADANAADAGQWDALHLAAYYGKAGVIHELLTPKPRVDVNSAHPVDGTTALGVAVRQGHVAVVELLLDEGADPLRTNHKGQNAFHVAAAKKSTSMLRRILDHCKTSGIALDINARDKKGKTVLMLVEENVDKAKVKFIASILRWEGVGGLYNIDAV